MSIEQLIDERRNRLATIAAIIALVISCVTLALHLMQNQPVGASAQVSTLGRIEQSKLLRVGYEGYPPYTIKDPTSGKLSGLSVELAEYIAGQAGWKVEWVQTSPDTKIPDLQAGRFDLMTEPIFRTIGRAARVTFSRPYAYFGDASGIVRRGEQRFKGISDLNAKGVTIVVRQGYTDEAFAVENLPEASLRVLKVDDVSQLFLEVISGKADIALADTEQVKAFAEVHASEVEARFTDPAPSYISAGFMLKQGDFSFYNFLNTSIDYVEANSVLSRLNQKYHLAPRSSLSIH